MIRVKHKEKTVEQSSFGGGGCMHYRAISADSVMLAALKKQTLFGVVDGLFAHSVNLRLPDKRLYSIVAASLDNGPDAIRVQGPEFTKAGVAVGQPVEISSDAIRMGRWQLSLAEVQSWQGAVPVWPTGQEWQKGLFFLFHLLTAQGQAGSLKLLWAKTEPKELFPRILRERAMCLLHLLAAGDPAAVQAGQELVGLGPGHTPAGDDFLAGIFLLLSLPGVPGEQKYVEWKQGMEMAISRTTTVSQAMLRHAMEGRAREWVLNLLAALFAGREEELESYGRQVLSIGSTSGTDLMAGLLAGISLLLRKDFSGLETAG